MHRSANGTGWVGKDASTGWPPVQLNAGAGMPRYIEAMLTSIGNDLAHSMNPEVRTNVLFICSRNQWRSPTAERVYRKSSGFQRPRGGDQSQRPAHGIRSRLRMGGRHYCDGEKHWSRLLADFAKGCFPAHKPLHVLDIPDDYQFMDPDLVEQLRQSVGAILGLDA